jgi:predicted DNA-binding protein YlxM (UPF0122 family)
MNVIVSRNGSRGRQYEIPEDFLPTVSILKDKNEFTRNSLVSIYNVAPSVIDRWLQYYNIDLKISNIAKEKLIDMSIFEKKITSGQYSIKEIATEFNLSKNNISDIVRRNNITPNYRTKLPSIPDENIIKSLFQNGKQKTAKEYGVTLSIINGWCRKHNIVLPKYHGRKRNDLVVHLDSIVSLYKGGHSLNFIGQIYNTGWAQIKKILESNGFKVMSAFDKWNIDKETLRSNLKLFIDENNSGLNLKEIALKYECSYEQLKAIFVEGDQDIILHSYNKSKGELEVKKFIEDLGFTVKSVKKKFEEDRFEIDCFIEDKNFGIEYCGEYWHSQNIGIKQDYHQRKTIWAQKQGIKLMTIFEHEWYTKRQLLENMIKIRLGLVETKIYARKTMIVIIPKSVACHFHNRNHIQGGLKTSTVDIGLYYNGELISVMSMGKSRFSKEAEYEILRFSTTQSTIVVGGFTKMFEYFKYVYQPNSVLSFCDLRFGEGTVYLKANFVNKSTTPPNYWYYYKKDGRYGKFESRIKYQKHKLKHLENFSHDKTEYDIMLENGFLKIYDCGSYKFLYQKE